MCLSPVLSCRSNNTFVASLLLRLGCLRVLVLLLMGTLYLPQREGFSDFTADCYEAEMRRLVELFNEDQALQIVPKYGKDCERSLVLRKKAAAHMEDSKSTFSTLVNEIVEKLSREGEQINVASAKALVLEIGLRVPFGVSNTDADPLEDNTPLSLWRWEVRELKFLPPAIREEISERRRIRKKISDRLKSLSSALEVIRAAEPNAFEVAVSKTDEILRSTEEEFSIRAAKSEWLSKKSSGGPPTQQQQPDVNPNAVVTSLTPNTTQENKRRRRSDPEEREKLKQEKLLKRQRVEEEREQRRKEKEEAEKEKEAERELKRKEREEAEKRREAEREQRRKEKEEAERKKEAERELKRKEKEEAVKKKQMALQKQASFMGRFLQASKKEPKPQPDGTPENQESVRNDVEGKAQSSAPGDSDSLDIVSTLDEIFQKNEDFDLEFLKHEHLRNWTEIRHHSSCKRPIGWGIRRKPKTLVFRKLRLQGANSSLDEGAKRVSGTDSSPKRLRPEADADGLEDVDWKGTNSQDSCPGTPETKKLNSDKYLQLRSKRKKLLQFDKSHRPPYYGTYSKRSHVIKPRAPFKQDPKLEYEVDSDAEWEEEEPGESLSDFENEKDEEEERVDNEDDEDSSDEFMVPDGYLSEDEGVHMEDGTSADAAGRCPTSEPSPSGQCVNDTNGANGVSSEQLRRMLDKVTEHALRTNRPLIINNLRSESQEEIAAHHQLSKTESLVLEALRMRILTPTTIGVP
ncbi:hypothetical protein R1sor_015807 [Riccia sorocarpa]|uniref:Chromatin assembly factor 1 subunit A dimerization domain-containing protein n=1 Tax=Riccia sorocarpa TaxID=122646 RepID=A0ABD3HDM5_9MARC